MTNTPLVSVIVPTRNRQASLLRLLAGVERQDAAGAPFEVIVVDDGSTDGTREALARLRPSFDLRVVEQGGGGAAGARNAGAAAARGSIFLFLDDDVEPTAGAFAPHVRLHLEHARAVGLGDYPPAADDSSFFAVIVRGWWLAMRAATRRRGHRYTYRDLLSGHLSMRRETFEALGGFDPEFRVHEDWELGYRVIAAGLEMRFLPDAVALHHESNDVEKAIRRKFDEGVADVQLARKHPALTRTLPFCWPSPGRKARLLRLLARDRAGVGRLLALLLRFSLPIFEAVRLRFRWRAALTALLSYWYWRGVFSTVAPPVWRALVAETPAPAPVTATIDLRPGIDAAARELDLRRPQSAAFVYGTQPLATVVAPAGAEALRGEHLPALVATEFPDAYCRALAAGGLVPAVLAPLLGSPRHTGGGAAVAAA